MDALTSVFSDTVKQNPQILEHWRAGRLCLSEAVEIIARQAIADSESRWMKEARENAARRFIEAFPDEVSEHGATVANVTADIESRPLYIINFLLDRFQVQSEGRPEK